MEKITATPNDEGKFIGKPRHSSWCGAASVCIDAHWSGGSLDHDYWVRLLVWAHPPVAPEAGVGVHSCVACTAYGD